MDTPSLLLKQRQRSKVVAAAVRAPVLLHVTIALETSPLLALRAFLHVLILEGEQADGALGAEVPVVHIGNGRARHVHILIKLPFIHISEPTRLLYIY